MSQRKLNRKTEKAPAKHLSLVPPPKPARKSRRRWKLPRIRRLTYEHNLALQIYEEEVVMAAIVARGGYGSVQGLLRDEPGRWDRRYLKRVLLRLYSRGKLGRDGHTHRGHTRYYPKEAPNAGHGG